MQNMAIKTLKKDVVFKNEDVPGVFLQALFQTSHVRLKDALFLVDRVFCYNHELNSWQQTDSCKLLCGLLLSVWTGIQSNTIDLIEKGPAIYLGGFRLIHVAGLVNC